MLDIRLRVFLFAICITAFLYLVYKMKNRKADIKYTLPWLFLDFLMLIITAFPKIIVWLCHMVGIQTASNAVFFAALVFLLIIVYIMSRTIARLNNEVRELTQRIALDEVENK